MAGQPAGAAAPRRRRTATRAARSRRRCGCKVARGRGGAVPARAGAWSRSASASACCSRWRPGRPVGWAGRRCCSRAGAAAGRAPSPRGDRPSAKWVLVGRFRAVEHPLWSSFVWRNELADTFVEMVAVPWFASAAAGTPVLNVWLRSLGAQDRPRRVVRDLLAARGRPGHGSATAPRVNRGCVLQTHLFHDRIMSMDTVTLDAGATLGPHGVDPAGGVDRRGATVGPASLVMRGERVPAGTPWIGNPIAPWPVTAHGARDRRRPRPSGVGDPYLPGHGNGGYRVRALRPRRSTTGSRSNRLDGRARLTAGGDRASWPRLSLDLGELRVEQGARGRPPGRAVRHRGGKLHVSARRHRCRPARELRRRGRGTPATRARSTATGARSAGRS